MTVFIPEDYGLAEFRHQLSGDAEPMITTCGFHIPGDAATADQVAEQFGDAWSGAGHPFDPTYATTLWTFTECVVTMRKDGDLYEGVEVYGLPGANTTTQPPSNCALLIRKNSGVLGRRNRGRFYQPPFDIPMTYVDVRGGLSGTLTTRKQAEYQSFFDDADAAATPLVILHSVSEILPRVITSLSVQSTLATQRRRMRP
jgi:hypothetical protein